MITPEMQALIDQLCDAQKALNKAKLFLEQVRQLGVEAENEVVAHRNTVHSLKDQIAALAGKE